MYKLLLITKYLRRKLIPLFAALAVTLCVAMVIIVISVMGGFLAMMRDAAHTLSGDVTIDGGLTGFPHYEILLQQLGELPEVEAATPVIRAYGLLNLHERVSTVEILGVYPNQLDRITGFRDTLYWTPQRVDDAFNQNLMGEGGGPISAEDQAYFQMIREMWTEGNLVEDAMSLETVTAVPETHVSYDPEHPMPGIIPGIEVNVYARRQADGSYTFMRSGVFNTQPATVTALPMTDKGGLLEPAVRQFVVVNEFKSGLYELDANRVYLPFEHLQAMLRMAPRVSEKIDPETGEFTGETERIPGQTTEILLRAAPGVSADQLVERVAPVVFAFYETHPDVPFPRIYTWEQRHGTLLNAVEREKGLLVVLFTIISAVAIVMISVIFYMIVLDKTRDIGILRSVGASRGGIAGIFVGYGLVIGILGAIMGLVIGAAVVWNLNEIQAGLYAVTTWLNQWWYNDPSLRGWKMWDPQIYYFDRIPSQLDAGEVTGVLIVAVLSSVLGSLVPAVLAARMDPVESLRYE